MPASLPGYNHHARYPNPHQDELAELVLKRVVASGAEYGDIRLLDSVTQTIRGEDRRIASIRESQDSGFGIRVLYHGAWGFAASSVLSLEEVPRVAELAIEIAKGSASVASEKVKLAEEAVHRDRVVTERRIDPFAVAIEKKQRCSWTRWSLSIGSPASCGAARTYGLVGTVSSLCRPKGRVWNSTSLP